MEKLKILYVINSSHKKAGGGHFYSLQTLTDSLTPFVDFKILNVGLVHADALKKNVSSDFIKITKLNFFFQIPHIIHYVKTYNPNIIHCFDTGSVSIMRTVNIFIKKPLIFSKCGGINGGRFIQDADAYINFSEENSDHFRKYKKNDKTIFTLPNRANLIKSDLLRINELRINYGISSDEKIIIRISRFHELHERSIMQALELLKLIIDSNFSKKYKLLLIGMPQSPDVIERVKKAAEGYPVQIITEQKFTNRASELLDMADIIVGTGRGVMEAASLNKILFAPVQNSVYPAPVNEENLSSMMYYNFSERNKRGQVTSTEILNHLEKDEEIIKLYSGRIFSKYFDIDAVVNDYLKIYKTTIHQGLKVNSLKNYLNDIIRFLKPKFISKNFYSKNINR